MQRVDKLLKVSVKKYKIEDKIKGYEVLKYWDKVIGQVLPEAKGKTMALAFEKGVLQIASLSREIADLVNMLAKRIIYALNAMLGKDVVFKISCVS